MPRYQAEHVPPHLGPALRAARLGAGKTLAESAQAAFVDLTTLENWEQGRTDPRCGQVLRLALFYGVPPLDLFGYVV